MTMNCERCGMTIPAQEVVLSACGEFFIPFCKNCVSLFGSCTMCENEENCGFLHDPDPMPKAVMQRRVVNTPRGQMTLQEQVLNPERKKKFCTSEICACAHDEIGCCKTNEFSTCSNYKEKTFKKEGQE